MTRARCLCVTVVATVLGWAHPGAAQNDTAITVPDGAVLGGHVIDPIGLYPLPAARFEIGAVQQEVLEGARETRAWTVPLNSGDTVYALFRALAEQIAAQGYTPLLRCGARDCGGFDFRLALDLLPPPAMFFDLSEYYVLTALRQTGEAREGVMLVVSRNASAAFGQITRIGARATATGRDPEAEPASDPDANPDAAPGGAQTVVPRPDPRSPAAKSALAQQLDSLGKAVLEDVAFAPGSSELNDVAASLSALAEYLTAKPEVRAKIVGHSDSSGNAAANLALSKKRADAVRQLLIEDLGVSGTRLTADGVGQQDPRDRNDTEEGRRRNRRVEVVLF